MDEVAAWASAAGVLLGAYLLIEWMIGTFVKATDEARGRDHCCYCGHPLVAGDGGLGYENVCRRCERSQPWSHEKSWP